MQPRGHADIQNPLQKNPFQTELFRLQPQRFGKPQQHPHHQHRADELGSYGCNRRPGNAHAQNHHAQQIHENIHNTGNGKEDQGPPGVSHGPQNAGAHIVHHGGQRSGKVQPDVGLGIGKAGVRGAHDDQKPGRGEHAEGSDDETQNQRQRHAGVQGILSSPVVAGPVELGQQHRCAGAETDEEAVQQIHQRGGGAHGGKGLGTHEPAHNDGIHGIVKLLEEGSQQNREEKS